MKFPIEKNDPIKEGSIAYNVIKDGKTESKLVDKSVFGFAYLGGGIPIYENSELVGSLVFGVSLNKRNQLMEISENLLALVQQVTASTLTIVDTSEKLSNKNRLLFDFMNDLKDQINRTSSIVSDISKIAAQTKILSLNALIEAARAGEHGRTFSVVAKETQKLADDSRDSSKSITTIMNNLKDEIINLTQMINESINISHNQFQEISDLSKAIETVSTEAQLSSSYCKPNESVWLIKTLN